MKRTRIILADDHTLLVDAVQNLLEPEYEVVGTFANGEELLENAETLSPDLIILDVNMPKISGLTACARLKELIPKVRMIFLSMHRDSATIGEAFRSGAAGYVLKTSAAAELSKAIREVLRGGRFVTPSLSEGMIGSFVQKFKQVRPANELTLRQKEVLNLLVEGHSMKEVATVLRITPRTGAYHKYLMMEQLSIHSSAELIT